MFSSPSSPSLPDPQPRRLTTAEELRVINPFASDICASWREAATEPGHYVSLHDHALDELRGLANEGRVVLLSAPRAGHGKTHLLGRVGEALKGDGVVAALPWQTLEGLSWEATGRGMLMDLSRAGQRPNPLQKLCGGVCATLLKKLIQVGRIPSTDPAQALRVLSQDPCKLFQAGGPAKVIGDWFSKHFEQLRRSLAEISSVDGLDEVELWVAGMFDYVHQPNSAALASLIQRLRANPAAQVARFLRLASVWKPVVLVADHMDGLYRDPMAGQAISRMTLELSGMSGIHLVLSMNQDLWDTAFGRNLPSAFEDRLTEHSLALRGLDAAEADALVRLRLRESGVDGNTSGEFLHFLDLERFFLGRPLGSVSARGLLRHAAAQWRFFVHSESRSEQGEEPSTGPWKAANPSAGIELPVFDLGSGDALRRVAASLAQDPQVEMVDVSGVATPASAQYTPPPNVVPISASSAAAEPESFLRDDDELPEPLASPGVQRSSVPPALAEVPASNLQRLSQMLAKLKVHTDSVPAATATVPLPPTPSEKAATSGRSPNGTVGEAHPVNRVIAERFETLRNEYFLKSDTPRVDWLALSDLVRLAGKRFPVVHYDELELPGLLGRSLPRWSIQGLEIVFGMEDFTDYRYWKTVSSFMAGRVAEFSATAAMSHDQAPQLKLVVFKGDQEGAALAALFKDEIIPPAVRDHVDTVHLDKRLIASLYAMRRLISEAEAGQLSSADPTAVLGTLARELDFFWKRITRPQH